MRIDYECVRQGQPAPYHDSLFFYKVAAPMEMTNQEVWDECQKLRPAAVRDDGFGHSGTSGFKYGLDTVGSLLSNGSFGAQSLFSYRVTVPFCD